MRAILIALAAALTVSAAPVRPDYPISPVPLTDVRITDHFWAPKIEVNRTVTIPHIMRQNEATGRVDNFLKAAHTIPGQYKGHRYDDTDVYKVIEAASYSLAAHPDPELDRKVDELIAIVAKAQEPDGYIYSARTADPAHPAPGAGPERWSWLSTSHELYNQGHLYEAAVAHFQATGKRTLLDVAIKSADLVCKVFGPNGRHDAPGHEEVELTLVKLYRVTGDRKYLDEAKFFLDQRGRTHTDPPHEFAKGDPFDIYNSLNYRQDDVPLVDQSKAEGHAVRATYLYNAMTDVATLDAQPAFGAAVDRLWTDVVSKRMYLTGGLGAVGRTEAFGDDYVLPNRAYAETCASVGGLLWYHRMFLREGDAKYYDTFERTLYNGYLSGVSLAGDSFFYQNPLVSDGRVERSKYFDVACCPANLARLMGQLPGLIYARRAGEVYVNLFIGSDATFESGGARLHITQTTDYPWQGRVTLHVDPERASRFDLAVRIPGWARGEAVPSQLYRFAQSGAGGGVTLSVNGTPVDVATTKGYARISREWRKGDVVELNLPMPVRRVLANDGVAEDRGKAAIQRGPVVYCLEGVDNGGHVLETSLPLDAPLTASFKPDILGGVDVVSGKGITAVPYYAWNNRGKGEMAVWIRYETVMILDRLAKASLYFGVDDRVAAALRYLQQTDLASLAPGRHDLDAGAYALVIEYDTRPRAEGFWEAHRRYVDVQYLAAGREVIGYASLAALEPGAYDEALDFLAAAGPGEFFALAAGSFVVFGPDDAHMPGLAVAEPEPVRKIVVKVPVPGSVFA